MLTPFALAPILLLLAGVSLRPEGYLVAEQALKYAPREGDLVFYDDRNPIWTRLFESAGSGPPLHMGIVVRRSKGQLAVLEAGPDDTVHVELRDLVPRLHQFQRDYKKGTISIRRVKTPLDRDQSKALTKFAEAQNGKRYAVLRLLAQGTSLRSRGPLEPLLGKTYTNRDAWICSELAVAAASVAGLVDPNAVHANSVYPRDLVDNQRFALGKSWHDAAAWRAFAPRR